MVLADYVLYSAQLCTSASVHLHGANYGPKLVIFSDLWGTGYFQSSRIILKLAGFEPVTTASTQPVLLKRQI